MVTFVGLNNTTRFVSTLTFEFAAMIVMSDCAPLKALPLMLMPPAALGFGSHGANGLNHAF